MSTPSFKWTLVDVPPPPSGAELDQQLSAIQQLKRHMMLDTSKDAALSVLGANYGIPRPPQAPTDDAMFMRLVRLLAWQPKVINFAVHHLLIAVFGSQAELIAQGRRPWRVYEVNANEIIIEIPLGLIVTSNENASYLHGWSGFARVTSGPTNQFTTTGDVRTSSLSTLVGKTIQVFHTGAWNDYTINAVSYSAGTDTSTVTVSAATLPTGGGYFFIIVPGDGSADSYKGDHLATSGWVTPWLCPATGDSIYMLGDAALYLLEGDVVSFTLDGGSPFTAVVAVGGISPMGAIPGYSAVQFTTSPFVLDQRGVATRQAGLELADTSTTAPHDLRVYLTGLGLYEVVVFYMNLLVRAAGVVLRTELI